MIEVYIDLTEVAKLAKKYGRGPEVVERETGRTMKGATEFAARKVQFHTPVGATQDLKKGVEPIVTKIKGGFEGRVTVTGRGMGYAEFVEFGTRPHWPPVEPIRLWVLRKLGVPAEEVPGVAFLVSRKIARVGTPAQRMFEQGWIEAEPKVMSLFNVMAYRVVEGIEK